MAEVRIRRDGIESTHRDLDEVRTLLRGGHAMAADEIWREGRWLPLGQVPELRALATGGADPWAAWAESDNVDADVVVREYTARSPAALPPNAVTAVGRPTVHRRPVDPLSIPELPPGGTGPGHPPKVVPWTGREEVPGTPPNLARALPPEPAGPPPEPPDPAGGGELVELPRAVRPRPPRPARDRREPGAAARAPGRFSRLSILAVSLIVLASMLYILARMSTFPGAARTRPEPVQAVEADGEALAAARQAEARFEAIEAEVRAVDLGRPRPVTERVHLGDALLVELQQLRVAVADVEANVTRWTGRRRDDPAEAEIHVVLRGGGDPERDVGAVAWVTGRYIQAYALEVAVLDVRWRGRESDRLLALPAPLCEDFARRRISLSRLLEIVTSPTAPPAGAPPPSGGSPPGSAAPGSPAGSSAPG